VVLQTRLKLAQIRHLKRNKNKKRKAAQKERRTRHKNRPRNNHNTDLDEGPDLADDLELAHINNDLKQRRCEDNDVTLASTVLVHQREHLLSIT
jgi:hypothetical protein